MEDLTDRKDLMCRMFRRTLEGDEIRWYKELPNESINSFEELKENFCGAFNHLIRRKADNGALLNIKQKESQNLRQYVKRFKENLEKVAKTDDLATITAFRAGQKLTCFSIKIFNKKPKALGDMMGLAYDAMEVEDMLKEIF